MSMLGVQPAKPRDFNALNFLDPFLSSPFQTPVSWSHLVAGKGRMASDRCGGGGRSSGKLCRRCCPRASGQHQTSRLWSRSGLEHKNDVARGLTWRQAGGDALAVRDRVSLTWPARRRLQGGEARTGFSAAGFRITTARSDRASSKRLLLKHSGRCPALRVPFHQLSERSREGATPCPLPRPAQPQSVTTFHSETRPSLSNLRTSHSESMANNPRSGPR